MAIRWVFMALLLACEGCAAAPPVARPSVKTIRVHFPHVDSADCSANVAVRRALDGRERDPLDAALRGLLAGPTEAEQESGLSSPFDHSVSVPSTPRLSRAQLDVVVKDGVATVSFATSASPYLHQAICARTAVTTSIERTLLDVPGIRSVRFAIEGVVIEEWDA